MYVVPSGGLHACVLGGCVCARWARRRHVAGGLGICSVDKKGRSLLTPRISPGLEWLNLNLKDKKSYKSLIYLFLHCGMTRSAYFFRRL